MNWYVLYVKSRNEKKVAARLQGKDIEVFCPLKIEERVWSDRIKKVEVPYFRSYVFARFEEKDAQYVLETPGVVRRLFWLGKPAVIRDEEMQKVIAFFEDYKNDSIENEDYPIGREVAIQRGVFKDRTGVVLQNEKNKVTLVIPALDCAFKVSLPKRDIEKI